MTIERHMTVKATNRFGAVLYAAVGVASLYGFVLLLPHLQWPIEETNPAASFVMLSLLAMGVGFVRLLLDRPYRQSLSFDPQLGALEVEYRYVGKTVSRTLDRTDVASVDWAVFAKGTDSETAGLRVILSDGPVLFLQAPWRAAAAFAEALGLQLNEIEWNAWPETPSVWNAERALYPAPATR